MASNIPEQFPAPFLVTWRNEQVPCCERHAKVILGMNNLMGKYTPMTENEGTEPCGDCVTEEAKRVEAERLKKLEGQPDKPSKRRK